MKRCYQLKKHFATLFLVKAAKEKREYEIVICYSKSLRFLGRWQVFSRPASTLYFAAQETSMKSGSMQIFLVGSFCLKKRKLIFVDNEERYPVIVAD